MRDLPLIVQNSSEAFCGNGFIHLNIAEIYEEDIGDQKTCAYFGNRGSKRRHFPRESWAAANFLKGNSSSTPTGELLASEEG